MQQELKFDKIDCKAYLKDWRLSKAKAKLLFKLRTRIYPVKSNFKNNVNQRGIGPYCELCKEEIDDQKHLLKCHVLKMAVPELTNTKVKYIFGKIDKMITAVKLLKKIGIEREELLKLFVSNH